MSSRELFRERSRTAISWSASTLLCLTAERIFRHDFGISPPASFVL
jgi:hypothetical protein